MRYVAVLTALLIFAACDKDKKKSYRCECTTDKGQITHTHEGEYNNASDGLPACQGYQDSLVGVDSTIQARCYLYRINDK